MSRPYVLVLYYSRNGGRPYGASHVSGAEAGAELSEAERTLAVALGKRLADIAARLDGAAP